MTRRSTARPLVAFEPVEARRLFATLYVSNSLDDLDNGQTLQTHNYANVNYGFYRVGDTAPLRQVTYRVHNEGTAPITVNQVTLPAGFVAVQAPDAGQVLQPGYTNGAELILQLDKTKVGTHTGNVVIATTGDPSPFTFEVTGTVGSYAAGVNALGTLAGGTVNKSGGILFRQASDYSGAVVFTPSVEVYAFNLSAARNNVALGLTTPDDQYLGAKLTVYRDTRNYGVLDVDEESAAVLPAIATIGPNPVIPTSVNGQLGGGSYLIKAELTGTPPSFGSVRANFNFSLTANPLPDPKVRVQASGKQAVADGDLTPAAADGTDLGTASIGGTVQRQFVVANVGTGPMALGVPNFASGAAGGFTLSGLPSTLPAGGTATLTVRLPSSATTTAGTRAAEIVIPTNDPLVGTFNFKVQATVTPVVNTDTKPPSATLITRPVVRTAGGKYYRFVVRYADAGTGIDLTSLNTGDLLITGPNAFSSGARLMTTTPAADGKSVDVTYRINAPGGTWDTKDNGLYTVAVKALQVKDKSNNFAPAGATKLIDGTSGVFRVKIPKTVTASFLPEPKTFSILPVDNDDVWS
jgi:hypothetical protein